MTLFNRYRHYAEVGQVITCPTMRLDARDWERPIVEGSGEIRVSSTEEFTYVLHGVPADIGYLQECLNRQRDNPYDGLMRFRLNVVDADGIDISGGWTVPKIEQADDGGDWTFSGEIDALAWMEEKPDRAGTQCIFTVPRHPLVRLILRDFVRTRDENGCWTPIYELEVLSSHLTFAWDDHEGTLSISVAGGDDFPQTYTENWLGEPLRIMFGQLVFPRVVARENPDRTLMWIRPSNRWHHASDWVALWQGPGELSDKDGFWRMYAALLTFIASARDKAGHPNFEANKVTRLYEELIQASLGSRWVWALTFASSAEALIKTIVPEGTKPKSADDAAIDSLCDHITAWAGDEILKGVAVRAVKRTATTPASLALRNLEAAGVVTSEQAAAWNAIRNRVMHGSLISRYSSEEEDRLLTNLAALTHSLTKHLINLPTPCPSNRLGFVYFNTDRRAKASDQSEEENGSDNTPTCGSDRP